MTAVARTRTRAPAGLGARVALFTGVAIALAAVSLLRPYALAFDPAAWLVWGRETGRLTLDTTSGPSWKPFPVLFTTPFALLGTSVASALWLVVARAGGLLALAGAFVLGERLAGRWAGIAAAVAIALSPWWAYNTALGNSEGLLAAAVVWAVIAQLGDHPRAALACATAAALMRPEAWPFLILYGAWVWRTDRRAVIVAAIVVPLLWFGPDVVGAGGALGASHNALGDPSPGSAKLASIPALAVLSDTKTVLTLPAVILALIGAALAGPLARRILLGAVAWVAIVAAMTVAGYAGNPRYLVAAAALGAVLAGAGAVRAGGLVAARLGRDAARAAPIGAARPRRRGPARDRRHAALAVAGAGGARGFGGGVRRGDRAGRGARGAGTLRALSDERVGAGARRLAARPPAARPRREGRTAGRRDPGELVLRTGLRASRRRPLPPADPDAATGRSPRHADRRRRRAGCRRIPRSVEEWSGTGILQPAPKVGHG